MSWIPSIPYENAVGALRRLYDRIKGPEGHLDNILTVHGLRPHSLEGHMRLYKNVLHHAGNTLPKWLLETIGTYVSMLNDCGYCVAHHQAGLERLTGTVRAQGIQDALTSGEFKGTFTPREQAILAYTKALTLTPQQVTENMVVAMKEEGLSDGEVLEVNQIVAYFAYANRTVLGLGVALEASGIGLSPGDNSDPENWSHG